MRLLASLLLLAGLIVAPAHAANIGAESSVTLTVTTGAHIANDIVSDTQEVTNACQVKGGGATLQNLTLIDPDDQGAALEVLILDSAQSIGTENSGASISDANALKVLARVTVATADYIDLGGVRVAVVDLIGFRVKCTAATNSLYVATITTGTPTYAGGSLTLRLWFDWD